MTKAPRKPKGVPKRAWFQTSRAGRRDLRILYMRAWPW